MREAINQMQPRNVTTRIYDPEFEFFEGDTLEPGSWQYVKEFGGNWRHPAPHIQEMLGPDTARQLLKDGALTLYRRMPYNPASKRGSE